MDEHEGPLPERPLLAPWLRRAEHDGTTLLEYGDAIVALEGRSVGGLLGLLDGSHDRSSFTAAEQDALARLVAEGVVVPGPATEDEEALREAAAAFLAPSAVADRLANAALAVVGSGVVADETIRLLPGAPRRAPWGDELAEIDLAVAAPAPAELPLLAEWNARRLTAGAPPWLLLLPFNGRFATVGPLFLPAETCCYECLVRRRAAALPDGSDFVALQGSPAAYPTGRSLAAVLAGAAALIATRWLARGDASLAGCFVAFEIAEGIAASRHRVLRVPRCEACSPASRTPPLLPWASAATR